MKKGVWCDLTYRIPECVFNEIVDFVEVELAWIYVIWSDENRKKYNTPWHYRFGSWRCPQAGIDKLKWEISLVNDENNGYKKEDADYGKPTHQSISAQEKLDIYTWIKEVRPKRPDPYACDEWDELNSSDILSEKRSPEKKEAAFKAAKNSWEIEQQYEEEDTEMLCRIMRIRNSLWT